MGLEEGRGGAEEDEDEEEGEGLGDAGEMKRRCMRGGRGRRGLALGYELSVFWTSTRGEAVISAFSFSR